MPEATGRDVPAPRPARGTRIGSVVLALIAVGALVAAVAIAAGHHDVGERRQRQTDALRAAADWTGVLINLGPDSAQDGLRTLRDGTVGALNADFEAAVGPFVAVVGPLRADSRGDVDSVSIDLGHPVQVGPELALTASSTDTVLVLATSQTRNAGDPQPRITRWNLRLGVSAVDGRMLISSLETLR